MQFYLFRRRDTGSELPPKNNKCNTESTNKGPKSDNTKSCGSRFTAGSKKKCKANRNDVNNVSASLILREWQTTCNDVPPEIKRFTETCDGNKCASVILTKIFLRIFNMIFLTSPEEMHMKYSA